MLLHKPRKGKNTSERRTNSTAIHSPIFKSGCIRLMLPGQRRGGISAKDFAACRLHAEIYRLSLRLPLWPLYRSPASILASKIIPSLIVQGQSILLTAHLRTPAAGGPLTARDEIAEGTPRLKTLCIILLPREPGSLPSSEGLCLGHLGLSPDLCFKTFPQTTYSAI